MKLKFSPTSRNLVIIAVASYGLNLLSPGYLKFFLLSDALAWGKSALQQTSKPKSQKAALPTCKSAYSKLVNATLKEKEKGCIDAQQKK